MEKKTAGGLGAGLGDMRSISASLSKFGNIQLASDLFADADTGGDDAKESPVHVCERERARATERQRE